MSSLLPPPRRQARVPGRCVLLLVGASLVSVACSEDDLVDKWYGTDVGVGYTLPDASDASDSADAADAADAGSTPLDTAPGEADASAADDDAAQAG